MRYLGTRAMEVTIMIEGKAVPTTEDNVINDIMKLLETHGNTFKVMLPENVKSLDDAKFIAFECVTGYPFTKEIASAFDVTMDTIKYMRKEFIYCLTIAEFKDFDPARMKDYIEKLEQVEAPKKAEVVE
jgi:hypothetical protein